MDQMKSILERFLSMNGVVLALVAGTDGLVIESAAGDEATDAELIAAMAISTLEPAEGLSQETGHNGLVDEVLEFERGLILFEPLSDLAVLVVLTEGSSSLGLVRRMARRERQSLEHALAA